jgi:cell shape-determining protein MreD
MFAFSLVAYAVLLLKQNFHLDAAIARFVIIGLGAMMVCLMQSAWLRLLGRISLPWQGLVERAVLVGMFTSTVAIPLLIFSWWFHQQRRITPLVDQTATS